MHTVGQYIGTEQTIHGETVVSFVVDDNESVYELESLNDQDVVLDVQKFYDKKSNLANRYLWKLCDLIAKALNTDKDTIYKRQIMKYGTFVDTEIPAGALEIIKASNKYIDVLYEYESLMQQADGSWNREKRIEVRCYIGSHKYDTKEMSILISGTVEDAKEIGVETMTPDEIAHALSCWKAKV